MRIVAADSDDAAAINLVQALDAETSERYPQEPVLGIDADRAVTVVFARLILDRIRPGEDSMRLVQRIDDILSRESPVMAAYYSRHLLRSAAARVNFVESDVRRLPAFRDSVAVVGEA